MNDKEKITIGLPVYNGEKTIKKTLNSILEQTFTDFQVIISDNNSTDNTAKICQEYSKKNSKITYFQQNENIGSLPNFKFVLNSANSEYFIWIAADDWWEPTFLEKNVSVLDSNEKFVASVSKINYYDVDRKNIKWKDAKILKFKIKKYHSYDEYPINGNYDERIKFYLRLNRAENVYSVFRSEILRKCCNLKESAGFDLAILLGALKFGEINIIDEKLMFRSAKGVSSRKKGVNIFNLSNEYGLIGKLFPWLPFTFWFIKNTGIKNFCRNFDYLMFENLSSTKYQIKHLMK
jgi:glycosyltransferase involved in cell wall biosynthesis